MVRTEVREILHNVVTLGSKSKYDNANAIFVLWLYKSLKYRPYLFPPVILEELDRANVAELANGQKKALRNYVKKMLQDMSPDLNNCPLQLENLTFECFSDYMVTWKQTKGKIRDKKHNKKHNKKHRRRNRDALPERQALDDDDELYYSRSTYEGCRTALAHIYRMAGVMMSSELKNQLKHFTGGLKRSIAAEKRETG